MRSMCAPSTPTPNTSGFSVHSTSTRPCAEGSSTRRSTQRTPSHATTTSTCHTQTPWRSESPPSSAASPCSSAPNGP